MHCSQYIILHKLLIKFEQKKKIGNCVYELTLIVPLQFKYRN